MYKLLLVIIQLLHLCLTDELLSVHIMWRHGARNPYFCNFGCDDKMKQSLSELTPVGMRQHYVLGQWLRKQYIDTGFLDPIFNENQIYIESSNTNRTIMSAYSNLQGMYPLGPIVPEISTDLLLPPMINVKTPDGIQNYALPNRIQVIPIHSIQEDLDYIMYMYCPKLWDNGAYNQHTDVYYDINNRSQELIKKFNKELKQNLTNIVELYEWRDTFISNLYNGRNNSDQLTKEMMAELDKIAGLGFLLYYTQDYYQASLLTSEFFKTVLDGFDGILNGTSKIKYHAYSAHDSSIYASLYALNLTNVECYNQSYFGQIQSNTTCITTYPDYTANLIYELYNSSTLGPYIKIMYNGTYVNVCQDQALTCQYFRFKSILKGIQKDYKKECKIDEPSQPIDFQTPWWAIIFFVLVLGSCICSISMVVIIHQKKQRFARTNDLYQI
ncbi:unnamed protein product [Paramecium sonneborni]|uniref:Histidine phosphatase family (Branch 2) protein n=1 Tax=Paramecium sonneborni TaxID=65129 RepID=A0A8S1MYI3_9CILI|nr:unnamed protein product [Paramecium sonneborni]